MRTVTRSDRVRDVVGLIARVGLASVWLTSGILKAADPRQTLVAVRGYRILSESLVSVVAAALPYLEIALGVLLLIGLATRLAALVAFIAGVISAAARGLSIDCGCFGGGGDVGVGQTAYTTEILRDVGFLLLASYLIVRSDTPLSVDRLVRRRVEEPA
jgi:uncharacterized membrane protein YphA (DoxX/SURF4 family)